MLQLTKKFKLTWSSLIIFLLVVIGATTINDLISLKRNKSYPLKETLGLPLMQDQIYADLVSGKEDTDWKGLDGTLKFIDLQFDCSDFRLVGLIRILYDFGDRIPADVKSKIEKSILNFRYWWDEPGGNSMCYWSENHQILYASAEYLIGKKYPDTLFPKSGMTGKEHSDKARKRILDWMEMRWKYGFTEFFSNVYYTEDIGGMINLINYASDEEITKKMEIIMDLLMYDVASQNSNTMFVSASGRAYEHSRKGGPNTTLGNVTNYYWGNGNKPGGMAFGLVTTKKYFLPPVIAEIGRDTGKVVIKQSSGLDISELKAEGYYGTDNRSMMMQLGMEAFTNPEIIRNTLSFVRANRMFTNGFISDLKVMDFKLLSWLHLEPAIARFINPPSDGVAIQRGNTYTYKTKDYSVYAAQNYHPGTYGDQQHVAGMNIGNSFSVFHTHPALELGIPKQSPNYWVGYGRMPDVGQDRNVSLSIYSLPAKKGLMEISLLDYTYAWFPKENFDTVVVSGNYAMGKKGRTYCALIAKNNLTFRKNRTDNLIQPGKKTFWIMEAGSETDDQSFEKFRQRILGNKCDFDSINLVLNYQSGGRNYQLNWGKDFKLDGQTVNTSYDRFDSPYSQTPRKAGVIIFTLNGKSLYLDFDKMVRKY